MDIRYNKLSMVAVGSKVKVISLTSKGMLRQRLMDIGFVPGTIICVLRKSPFGDPTAYNIKNCCIALRKEEADDIIVELMEAI